MSTEPRPCLSVIIPCYNEQGTIASLIAMVQASPWVQEIIVVDDGSQDKSREILEAISDPQVRVIMHSVNQGKGAALRTGFSHATSEFVIVQDADLEYDPSEYPLVLEPLLDHRVLYFWHSLGNRFLTLMSNMFTDLNLTDMETCYKCFRREVIQAIDIEEDRFGFEPEITAKLAKLHLRIYEVGISYSGRTYDEGKKIGWRDGVRAIYCIVRYSKVGDKLSPLFNR
jgi:glycosyltransferase involved in cell wall biosynthesis